MIKKLLCILATVFAPLSLFAGPYDNLAQVEVLPGWRMPDGSHMAGLRITLQPGWKTYWRAPGDAGIPSQFNFSGSANIQSVKPHWPVPIVFDQGGQRSIGYQNMVVFPLTIAVTDADAPLHLAGQIDIGVCEEICIPVTLTFDQELPQQGTRDAAITAALINRPLSAAEASIGPVTCAITPIQDGLRLTASVLDARADPSEVVIIETGNENIWVSEAEVTQVAGTLQAVVDMVHITGDSFALDRSKLRVTLLRPGRAVELRGCQAG